MVPTKFQETSEPSRLTFIGEAPGRVEIGVGEPFRGPSGQLLNNVLSHYGIMRAEVTLTNAALCHYPDSMKKLPDEAIECCRPRLEAELELSGAQTIVPMGNSAVKAVFPKDLAKRGITQLRVGRPRTLPGGRTVVPTFHPAFCLRAQEKFPLMLSDMGKAVSSEYLPDLWYEPEIVIVGPFTQPFLPTDIVKMIIALNQGEVVFFDVETGREKDVSYGNVHMNKLLCVGVGPTDPANADKVFVFTPECFESETFRKAWRKLLSKVRIGAQNRKYDVNVMRQFLGYADFDWPHLPGEDTMLMSYVNYEYSGVHGLEYMGMELLGTPDWKHDIEPYLRGPDGKGEIDYSNIPTDILYKYNAFDVHATRLLHSYFARVVQEEKLDDAYRFTLRLSDALTLIEPRGIGFDVPYSQEVADRLQGEREELGRNLPTVRDLEASTKKLREWHPLNVDSSVQVSQYLAEHGVKVDNTEADTLSSLLNKWAVPDEVKNTVRLVLDIRKITKMDGTFVTGLRNRTTAEGTVHPSFLVHGTTSGRLSSRSPNSQNIPRAKEIKAQFIARASDRVLVGCDMGQAELRVLTWLAREELARDIFNDPARDLFVELCRSMFPDLYPPSLSDDEVKALSNKDAPGQPSIRTLVKTFAYGIAYGRTASGIAADPQFHMDVAVAQRHLTVFEKTIPNIIAYLEDCADRACRSEELVTPYFGRRRRFHLITSQNIHAVRNEAKSFPAQSIASDIVALSACRLTFDHHVPIVNLVHDAIYADVPRDEAEQVRDLIVRVMVETGEEVSEGYVKFAADGKIGRSWADV
jgi:uracil-DNA glycosylase family 4